MAERHCRGAQGQRPPDRLPARPVPDPWLLALQVMPPPALRAGPGAAIVCAGPIAVGSPQQPPPAAAAPHCCLDEALRMAINAVGSRVWLHSVIATLYAHFTEGTGGTYGKMC